MDLKALSQAKDSLSKALGNWWKDDRQRWCAYCGIPMRRKFGGKGVQPPSLATRDHVVAKAHSGLVCIPACCECNSAKSKLSLAEFLVTDYFKSKRQRKHRNQWPIVNLLAVSAVAYLDIAAPTAASTNTE